MNKTFYEILGVSLDATILDIKNAYREKCMEYHPTNAHGNEELSHNNTYLLNEAYSILRDKKRRKTYDEYLVSISRTPIKINNKYDEYYQNDFDDQRQTEFIAWLETYIDNYLHSVEEFYTDPRILLTRYNIMYYSFDSILKYEKEKYKKSKETIRSRKYKHY